MKNFPALALCISMVSAWHTGASAQAVYRIVGPDGKITFSDQPPPPNASVRSAAPVGGSPSVPRSTGPALPLELRQVASRYPVTLYSGPECGACTQGRALLTTRGIPYAEKTVTTPEDIDAYQRLSSGNTLPMLTIGGQQLKGFSETEWVQYLDAAGYPRSSQLPAGFINARATPLVTANKIEPKAPAATPAATPADAPSAPSGESANPNNPAGIRF